MAEIPQAPHDFETTLLTDCGLNSVFGLGACDLFIDGPQLFNHRPIANAGEDRIVNPGSAVVLDGTESYDVDGQIVSFGWEQINGEEVFIVSSDIECLPSAVKSKLKSVKETSMFVRIISNIKTR